MVALFVLFFLIILIGSIATAASDRSAVPRRSPRGDWEDDDYENLHEGGGGRSRKWSAFNFPPNRPDGGPWRITRARVVVSGTKFRDEDVRWFAYRVEAAMNYGLAEKFTFAVTLEAEPTNRHDKNAVRVVGTWEGQRKILGYLPRDVVVDLGGKELPTVEVSRYFERGDYTELQLNLLERRLSREERTAAEVERLSGVDVVSLHIDPHRQLH